MGRNLVVLLLFLMPSVAGADTPRMEKVHDGILIPENGWVLNDEGYEKLRASLDRQHGELITLRAENSSLQLSLKEMESKPALTFGGAAVLIGIGLVVGAALAVPVVLLAKR